MIIEILAIATTIIGLLSTVSVLRWRHRRASPRRTIPGISILKPIRGLEPELAANLHSFFNLNGNVPFEIIFCVKNPEDPCIPLINHLRELHPQVSSKLFVGTPDLGRNPKVSNMYHAWNQAAYDLVLISDSNVRVEPDYLEMLLVQRQKGGALVTQAVYGVGAKSLGGHLDVVHLNSFYLKATAFLSIFGFSCVLGKCMLFSRYQFDRLGGLFSVRNYLAEDLVAGEMMKDAGYSVKVAPQLLRQTTIMTSFKAYWNRHVRWARLRKCHFPHAYLTEPLLFETVWPLLLFVLAPTPEARGVATICLALQILSNLALYQFKFNDEDAWKSFSWFWLKDFMAPVIWTAGLLSNKVNWRGQILHLRWGGKLGSKYMRSARLRLFKSPYL